jgi:hypothetical protein
MNTHLGRNMNIPTHTYLRRIMNIHFRRITNILCRRIIGIL